jgi:hypothetical protein
VKPGKRLPKSILAFAEAVGALALSCAPWTDAVLRPSRYEELMAAARAQGE